MRAVEFGASGRRPDFGGVLSVRVSCAISKTSVFRGLSPLPTERNIPDPGLTILS